MPEWPEQFVLDFIAEYRKYECLWKLDVHRSYKEVTVAFENLQKFCEKSNKPATIKFIKNTIKELKKSHGEELIKFLQSVDKSNDDKDIYRPNLYYFKAMNFIIVEQEGVSDLMKINYYEEKSDLSQEIEQHDKDNDINDDDFTDESIQDQDEEENITEESNSVQEDEDQTSDGVDDESIQDQEDDIKEEPYEGDDDQISDVDSIDESNQDLSDTGSLTPRSEQPEENTDDLFGVCRTGEFDSVDDNEDEIIDDRDFVNEPIQELPRPVPATPGNKQWVDVKTSHRTSSDVATSSRMPSNTQKKIDENEENTNDLISKLIQEINEFDSIVNNVAAKHRSIEAGNKSMPEIGEFNSITSNKDRKIDDRVFMNESVQNLPVAAPTTHANEQCLNGKTAYWKSPNTQKNHKKIASKQSFDVSTSSRILSSAQKNHKNMDQNEGNTNGMIRVVALSKLMQRRDEFDNISSNRNRKIDNHDIINKPILSLPVLEPTTSASGQWVDVKKTRRISSDTQENRKKIVNEKSFHVATSSRISNSQKHKKVDENEENTNDLVRTACNEFRQETDKFEKSTKNVAAMSHMIEAWNKLLEKTDESNGISNRKRRIDYRDDLIVSNAATPTTEQSVDFATASEMPSNPQKKCKETVRKQTVDVATTSRISFQQKYKKIASKQSVDVSTTSAMLSDTPNKKNGQYEQNTDNLLGVREADEFGSIGDNEDQIMDDRQFMDESVQNISDAAPITPTSKRLVDAKAACRASFDARKKQKKIANEKSFDVATASMPSNTQRKQKKIDQSEEDMSDLVRVGCSKPRQESDKFDSIGNNEDHTIHDRDDPIENLFGTASSTIARKQSADMPTLSHSQEHTKITNEQSANDATTSRISLIIKKKRKKVDQNEENTNDLFEAREIDEFQCIEDQMIDDREFTDESIQNISNRALTTPRNEQWVNARTAYRMLSGTHKKRKSIASEQSFDFATTSKRSSNTQKKRKKLDHNEHANVTCSKLMQELDVFDNTGDNEEQIIYDPDESIENLSEAASSTFAKEQLVDVATSGRISSNTQKKRKEIDQNLENPENPLGVTETHEIDSISNNEDQISDRDFMDESIQGLSDASRTPTSALSSDFGIANMISPLSPDTQRKRKNIASELTSGISCSTQKKLKQINQVIIACSKFMKELDEYDNIGNNQNQRIHNRNESVDDLSDSAFSTLASKQLGNVATTSWMSSGTQKQSKKVAREQSVGPTTTSRISNRQSNFGKGVCGKSIRQTDQLNNGEDQMIDDCDESIEDHSDAHSSTPASEQSDDRTASSLSSSTQTNCKKTASEQLTDVATTSKKSSNPQRNHKKADQNKGTTNDFRNGARNKLIQQTDESDSVGNDEDQINEDLIEDNSSAASPTPVSELSDDRTTSTLSSSLQTNRKGITTEQLASVATTSRTLFNMPNHKKIVHNEENPNDLVKVVCGKLMKETDEHDSFGNHVAAKLRGITASQRIIAEKLISDILYHAQMNSLNPEAVAAHIPLALAPNP